MVHCRRTGRRVFCDTVLIYARLDICSQETRSSALAGSLTLDTVSNQYLARARLPVRHLELRRVLQETLQNIDREFVTSPKKFANFNEFSEIKKIRKNSYKNSLNARVGVAFQWNSLLNFYFFMLYNLKSEQ